MFNITQFSTPSSIHKVDVTKHGFEIYPINESKLALLNFQNIVSHALKYAGNDYKVLPHFESLTDSCDLIFFYKINED